jgi:hypothetical protein
MKDLRICIRLMADNANNPYWDYHEAFLETCGRYEKCTACTDEIMEKARDMILARILSNNVPFLNRRPS